MSRPNVLLLVWDACRRDALEPYGAPAGASPVAGDLARRGVVAPDTHAPSCWTLPSHAAMFTGLMPRDIGLTQAPGGTPASVNETLVAHTDRLLAERFRRAGYATAGSSANIWIDESSGFGTGFDSFELVKNERFPGGMYRTDLRGRYKWARQAVGARVDEGARRQRERVLGWIRDLDERPFFWFVNLNECHSPYLPPKPFNDLGPIGRALAADENRRYLTLLSVWRACAGGFDVPDRALRRMRHLYGRGVAYMDAWLGDVLEALDGTGRLDDTLVVLTSDHGENLGEGGLLAHAFSLDERLVHVPLVAAGPGAERLAGIGSLADLPRLIADAAGLEGHPYAEHPTGVSQFDPLAPPDDPRIQDLFAMWPDLPAEQIIRRTVTPLTAVREGRYKLVLRGEQEERFDLESDPLELAPDAAIPDTELGSLRAKLSPAADHAGEVASAQASAEELADIEDRMRLLGYM